MAAGDVTTRSGLPRRKFVRSRPARAARASTSPPPAEPSQRGGDRQELVSAAPVCRRSARAVADRAWRNYLVAALAADDLSRRRDAVEPDAAGFHATSMPSPVGEALSKYLERLTGDRQVRSRGLLTALAYAGATASATRCGSAAPMPSTTATSSLPAATNTVRVWDAATGRGDVLGLLGLQPSPRLTPAGGRPEAWLPATEC